MLSRYRLLRFIGFICHTHSCFSSRIHLFSQGRRFCHKCKEPGHLARACPKRSVEGQGRLCHKCKEPGHLAAECCEETVCVDERERCRNCWKVGHNARHCPSGPVRNLRAKGPESRGSKSTSGTLSMDKRFYTGHGYTKVEPKSRSPQRKALPADAQAIPGFVTSADDPNMIRWLAFDDMALL